MDIDTRSNILKLIPWLFTIYTIKAELRDSCRPIRMEDVKVATRASYQLSRSLVVEGRQVSGTKFSVEKLVQTRFMGSIVKALVAHSDESSTLVCFEGDTTFLELLCSGSFVHEYNHWYQWYHSTIRRRIRLTIGGKTVRVMSYFWNALLQLVPSQLISTSTNTTRYIITGHSLGGALASLFSLYLKENLKERDTDITFITFGQPRVGDESFSRLHDVIIPRNRKLRFVYRYDIMPHFPGASAVPRYRHHSREIWVYKRWSGMNSSRSDVIWWFCSLGDTNECSGNGHVTKRVTRRDNPMVYYYNTIVTNDLEHRHIYLDQARFIRQTFEEAQCSDHEEEKRNRGGILDVRVTNSGNSDEGDGTSGILGMINKNLGANGWKLSTNGGKPGSMGGQLNNSDEKPYMTNGKLGLTNKILGLRSKEHSTNVRRVNTNVPPSTSDIKDGKSGRQRSENKEKLRTSDGKNRTFYGKVVTPDNEMTKSDRRVSTSDQEVGVRDLKVGASDGEVGANDLEVNRSDNGPRRSDRKEATSGVQNVYTSNSEVATSDGKAGVTNRELTKSDRTVYMNDIELTKSVKKVGMRDDELINSDQKVGRSSGELFKNNRKVAATNTTDLNDITSNQKSNTTAEKSTAITPINDISEHISLTNGRRSGETSTYEDRKKGCRKRKGRKRKKGRRKNKNRMKNKGRKKKKSGRRRACRYEDTRNRTKTDMTNDIESASVKDDRIANDINDEQVKEDTSLISTVQDRNSTMPTRVASTTNDKSKAKVGKIENKLKHGIDRLSTSMRPDAQGTSSKTSSSEDINIVASTASTVINASTDTSILSKLSSTTANSRPAEKKPPNRTIDKVNKKLKLVIRESTNPQVQTHSPPDLSSKMQNNRPRENSLIFSVRSTRGPQAQSSSSQEDRSFVSKPSNGTTLYPQSHRSISPTVAADETSSRKTMKKRKLHPTSFIATSSSVTSVYTEKASTQQHKLHSEVRRTSTMPIDTISYHNRRQTKTLQNALSTSAQSRFTSAAATPSSTRSSMTPSRYTVQKSYNTKPFSVTKPTTQNKKDCVYTMDIRNAWKIHAWPWHRKHYFDILNRLQFNKFNSPQKCLFQMTTTSLPSTVEMKSKPKGPKKTIFPKLVNWKHAKIPNVPGWAKKLNVSKVAKNITNDTPSITKSKPDFVPPRPCSCNSNSNKDNNNSNNFVRNNKETNNRKINRLCLPRYWPRDGQDFFSHLNLVYYTKTATDCVLTPETEPNPS